MAHIRQLTGLLPQPVRFGLRRMVFMGSAENCILCGNSISGYKGHGGGAAVLETRNVVGGKRREDNRCPVCHGADRTRLMMTYLDAETDLGTRPMRLLHVAPDFGLYLWLKRQDQLTYTGTDLDASRYRHIDGMQSTDLTATPFDENTFDLIVCSHVLEHIPNDAAAFDELFRILTPGGHALLLTPYALDGKGTDEDPTISDPAEQDRRFGQWDHVRIYDRENFLTRMRKAGFDASLYDAFEAENVDAEKLRLNPDELLPIGRKPLPA
ncbi:MAG: class I SAM-dependent methyltransferase [Pseudomonadota bacterium]